MAAGSRTMIDPRGRHTRRANRISSAPPTEAGRSARTPTLALGLAQPGIGRVAGVSGSVVGASVMGMNLMKLGSLVLLTAVVVAVPTYATATETWTVKPTGEDDLVVQDNVEAAAMASLFESDEQLASVQGTVVDGGEASPLWEGRP